MPVHLNTTVIQGGSRFAITALQPDPRHSVSQAEELISDVGLDNLCCRPVVRSSFSWIAVCFTTR